MPTYISMVSLGFLVIWLARKVVDVLASRKRNAPYPPGPEPKLLIGNMLDFPTKDAAQAYAEWGKKYNSSLLHAAALGNHVLIVNSLDDAEELFDRRAKKYSDRPVIPIIKLMGWEYNIALLRYGESWRLHRKICQQNFRAEAAREYRPLQMKKVHKMLQDLLDKPDDFENHNKMLSISIPLVSMYGYEVESFEDPCVVASDKSVTLGAHLLIPGSSWINVFPPLEYVPAWFPGASSHKVAAEIKKLSGEMERIPLEFVKKGVTDGTAPSSLMSDFLRKRDNVGASKEEEEAVRHIATTIYGAASDTTISAIGTFFYVMAANPDTQKKAQDEIDRVIGSNRLPDFEDRDSLPYIEAIYREVLRFKPPVPLGIPHALSEDDYYKGYFIPKGTTVLSNIWAMTHNEELYPEPFKFKPERFFDENGKLNDDNKILAYGFGRRVCVGKHIASSTVWLVIASVLAGFSINKSKDEFGNDIEINDDYEDFGFLKCPNNFSLWTTSTFY